MWELDYKESWVLKNWCFWTVALEKTLESPLDCKEIKPINPKGYQSWIFIGRTDAEAETPVLWPPDAKNWLTGKDPVAGKDWRQEEKGMTDDEMVGWHHWLDGHEFEQAPEVDDGQGSLACCSPRGCKELNMTDQLNWFDTTWRYSTTSKGLLPVGNWMGEVRGFNYICDALFKNSSDANMENVNNCWFLEVFSIKHMVRRFDFSSSLDMFSFPSGMFVMSEKESDEMIIGVCCLVTKSCPTLCDSMDCSIPGFPVLHYLLECPRGSYHWVGDVNQPSHPLSPPSPPALNLSVLYKLLFLRVSVMAYKTENFTCHSQKSQDIWSPQLIWWLWENQRSESLLSYGSAIPRHCPHTHGPGWCLALHHFLLLLFLWPEFSHMSTSGCKGNLEMLSLFYTAMYCGYKN